jgi:phosphoribosylformimino-5-aminoimidazole carboxamide ribonucleotide (ProFAR) isomerase
VTFLVIPAIDVAAGRLARPSGDGLEPVGAFDGDPRRAAEAFLAAGTTWIHVVDLDLAERGEIANLEVVATVSALGPRVQASGGVSSGDEVERFLDAGASRVVLGSSALGDRDATEEVLARFGDEVAIGIEADGPTIRPRGRGGRELPMWDTLGWLAAHDVHRFLLTEVGRVGALAGPDLDGIWALAIHSGRPVIAAGGVRDLDDVRAVADLGGTVEGVLVGRALYDGRLDLAAGSRMRASRARDRRQVVVAAREARVELVDVQLSVEAEVVGVGA